MLDGFELQKHVLVSKQRINKRVCGPAMRSELKLLIKLSSKKFDKLHSYQYIGKQFAMELRSIQDINEKVYMFYWLALNENLIDLFFQLGQLLSRNENLPEKDQLPPDSFILDQDLFDSKLNQAENEIRKEYAALEKEAEEHQKAVQATLSTFWLEMDEPSRSISVSNIIFGLKAVVDLESA
jgi:hypothetical protein